MKKKTIMTAVVCLFGSAVSLSTASAQPKRAIEPSDCVTVRYLSLDGTGRRPLQLNPSGTRLAYLVKAPNLSTNQNDIELYTVNIANLPSEPAPPSLTASHMSSLQWLADDRHIALLIEAEGKTSIETVDTDTGQKSVLLETDQVIRDYSIDQNGTTIVFTVDASEHTTSAPTTSEEAARGFRIPFQQKALTVWPHRQLFVTYFRGGSWTRPENIALRSPFTGKALSTLTVLQGLRPSLSPDGSAVLLQYVDPGESLPEKWKRSPYIRLIKDVGFTGVPIEVLYQFRDKNTTIPLKTPSPLSIPLWSKDSSSFAMVAESPVGSPWEEDDLHEGHIRGGGQHLFMADRDGTHVEEIASHVADLNEQPLWWNKEDRILVHVSADTLSWFDHEREGWHEASRFHIPLSGFSGLASLAANESTIAGDYQNPATPPELFVYRIGEADARILVRLNPQFDRLQLASSKEITWKTSTGYIAHGILLEPSRYLPGMRYPLVVQTHPAPGGFVCDSGENHFPSYAPQPMAAAGMMYLMPTYPENEELSEEEAHYPTGYPGEHGYGGLEEAAFAVDLWDSAVSALDARGMVDPARVGIMGFSRKGWYTEFILGHAKTHYRAATVADNVQYSVGDYWLFHDEGTIRAYDAMYGGPPYGDTLKNWMKYSVSFNIDKFHTPLLMEKMGYGIPYSDKAPSLGLATHYEVFSALNRLHKPVELYYYPDENHQMDHPQARLASLERNLDWYRFWLEGYERPATEDREQYSRWRALRTLQSEDETKSTR